MTDPQLLAPAATCRACGSPDLQPHIADAEDYLFKVPGRWHLSRCGACGTLCLDPMPDAATIAAFYKSYFTHDPIASPKAVHEPDRRWRGRLARALRAPFERSGASAVLLRAGLRLLLPRGTQTLARSYAFMTRADAGRTVFDYGCGNGDLIRRLHAVGVRAGGTDFDPEALAACRSAGLDVLAIEDTRTLPPASLDVVTCMNVIEHVPDPDATLAWFRKILAPDGRLLLETPNADAWLARAFGRGWRGLEVPRHLNVFSWPGLRALLARNGFEVVSTRFVPAASFMVRTSLATPRRRMLLRTLAPLIDLAGCFAVARREVLFVEARRRA